ncbi:MAG: class I SAM-dependent methyltransferase [Planctomycetota bacterium]
MQSDYASRYRQLYEQHWWWRSRESVILPLVDQFAAGRTDLRMLDIGCGDGLFFDRLSQYGKTWGVEVDESIVSEDGPHRDRIQVGPFDESYQVDDPLSLVLMLDVLEHLDEPEACLRHALSLLGRDGLAIITVPAFNTLWTRHDDINHHRTRYTKRTFRSVAEAAGMHIDRCEYFFHWVVFAKLLVRLKETLIQGEPKPAELPSPPVNQLLRTLSKAERAATRWLHLPFGSSLLVIGRKMHS